MFALIPGFSRNKSEPSTSNNQRVNTARRIYLEPIQIHASRLLWRAQLTVHLLFAVLLLWVLLPWLFFSWRYTGLLAGGWMLLAGSARFIWQRRLMSTGVLSFGQTGWQWRDREGVSDLELTDDVVAWPGLILLSFKERQRRCKKILALLPDSLAADDLRRLRVWLRTVLPRI